MSSASHHAMSRHRGASMSSSGRSGKQDKMAAETKDFTSPTAFIRYFEPTAATASMFLYGQGNSVVVAHHDSLTIERRFSRHSAEVQLLSVDTQSEIGAGRLVVSYDAEMTAIVWDLMTGDEVARFASYENLTCAAWMRNGNVAFGNTQGNVILFEPTTSEHISARTLDQIAVTALAPAADCRTFAIGYQNGSILIATLQPRFTILHNLSTSRAPSPIVSLTWHASSSRQKSDMLGVQTSDGDLRVWSVAKSFQGEDSAKVVRILKRNENYQNGPNWMGWSKNGRIIQYSDGETLSWDVRTKHVTYDSIPTLEHVRGLAVYGPGATLFTLGANNTVQQFDLNTPSLMVANVQHPANLLPPSPPVSIEEQAEQAVVVIGTESDSSIPINTEVSESDEDHMSPLARIVRGADKPREPYGAYEDDRYRTASPVSHRSRASSAVSKSSAGSSTRGRQPPSVISRGMTENTYISAGSSMKSSAIQQPSYRDKDTYSISSLGSQSITSSSRASRQRPSRLRNEVVNSPIPEDNKVHDLFSFTRSRLHDVPYKRPPMVDQSRLTTDDLRRQMMSIIFGWNGEMEDLIRDEMARHAASSPSRILLAKWLGDIDQDVIQATSENMTSSDWMLLALSGIGGQASQHKLGRAYVQRLLENGDVHAAVTIMIGMGDHNDAIEIYVSHKKYMEAVILLCLFFPNVWERQTQVIKKWGEFAVQHGQQQLAIRCFACTGLESSEPWASPSAKQLTFQSMNPSIPEVLSPPLSPPDATRGPQRSIAKSSSLRLITTFGDQQSKKSKFFAGDDGGQTPLAGGATPIAESAVSPGPKDPSTAFLRPSQRSAFNTPASAIPPQGGFGRPRLPSIGEVPASHLPQNRTAIPAESSDDGDDLLAVPPPAESRAFRSQRPTAAHSRTVSDDVYTTGMSLGRSATASPMMVRDSHRRKDPTPPSPSPESLRLLAEQGRTSRNGARDRKPDGVDLRLNSLDETLNSDITSPEPSVASSARFHWPTRRRGPGSVAGSVTSQSSAGGKSHRSRHVAGGRSLDYISSLDAAKHSKKQERSRERSRQRYDDQRGGRSRESSRTRWGGGSTRESSEDRGRGITRNYTPKPAKRSPTSPIPMSPEDLINLSTPRQPMDDIVAIEDEAGPRDPSTVRKATSQIRRTSPKGRISSRASSRRRRSPDRKPAALDLRGRSASRGDGSTMRSPSSPLPMTSQSQQFFAASDDEEDYRAAVEAQEQFRNRHNRSGSAKDPISPAVSRQRDRSSSRLRNNKTPAELDLQMSGRSKTPKERSTSRSHAGDLKQILSERQKKKELAARELEERRKSLALRPSAPAIPHPQELSPIIARAPSAFELPQTTYQPPKDIMTRSHTADPYRSSGNRSGNRPIIGLPATPKAMRLKFNNHDEDVPSVPQLPPGSKTSPSSSPTGGKPSPERVEPPARAQTSEPQQPTTAAPMMLLPSTVYSPPARPHIDRCMSAPIPDEPQHRGFQQGMQSSNRPLHRSSASRKMSVDTSAGMRGIDEMLGGGRAHSRKTSRDDQMIPPPPPPPPMVQELQHLAVPPPPPPAPLPGSKPQVFSGGKSGGTIEIVMDEDEEPQQQQAPPPVQLLSSAVYSAPAPAPMSEATVPIIAPPAPPSSRNGHRRGRSNTDNSIASRFTRATERMRSASRGRKDSVMSNRTKSPSDASQTSPYESLNHPPVSYNAHAMSVQQQQQQQIERHPRDVRAAYNQQHQTQQEMGTGLLESEMI